MRCIMCGFEDRNTICDYCDERLKEITTKKTARGNCKVPSCYGRPAIIRSKYNDGNITHECFYCGENLDKPAPKQSTQEIELLEEYEPINALSKMYYEENVRLKINELVEAVNRLQKGEK